MYKQLFRGILLQRGEKNGVGGNRVKGNRVFEKWEQENSFVVESGEINVEEISENFWNDF